MGSKRRKTRKQHLYKMKGCSRKKRCVGGSRRRKKRFHRPNLFVTYTGGTGQMGGASQMGGCGCSNTSMNGGGQSGGCDNAMCPIQGGGGKALAGGRKRYKKGGGMLDYGPYIAGSVTSALQGYKGPVSPSPLSGQFSK
jgi:hypothetical protein